MLISTSSKRLSLHVLLPLAGVSVPSSMSCGRILGALPYDAVCGLPACRWGSSTSNTLSLVKKLRDQSGAPISDVKRALEETGWDMELAAQELRKKGLSAASKKASRSATEGLVGLASTDHRAAIVEINSETDFVARNDLFTSTVSKAAQALLCCRADAFVDPRSLDAEELGAIPLDASSGSTTLKDAVQEVAGTVRENIKLRRGILLQSATEETSGVVGTYVHAKIAGVPSCGRIAGAVLLEPENGIAQLSAKDVESLRETANRLAMHVVGSVPKYLDKDSVPPEDLEKERKLLVEQASTSGKPANIVEKMVEGRLGKFYGEHCLLEQAFVMDDTQKVSDIVKELGKALDRPVRLGAFARIAAGEGSSGNREGNE
jgi:elongation factor Ts